MEMWDFNTEVQVVRPNGKVSEEAEQHEGKGSSGDFVTRWDVRIRVVVKYTIASSALEAFDCWTRALSSSSAQASALWYTIWHLAWDYTLSYSAT